MPLVRVVRGRHNGRDSSGKQTVFEVDDTLEVTQSQYEAFKDKLELVNKDVPKPKEEKDPKVSDVKPPKK